MRRVLLLVAVAAMVCAPTAGAWTWPTDGPVIQPFVFDAAHPYAGGEHRGIDIAATAGADVLAPRGGTVTFAGSVPGSGLALTIATADGYAVTLTQLGALAVARGATVAEGDVVGRVAGGSRPFVHLGVRVSAQAQGYVDPASLLPPRTAATAPVAPPPAAAPDPAPVVVAAPAPAVAAATPVPAPVPSAPAPAAPEPTPATPAFLVRARPATTTASTGGLRIVAAAEPAPAPVPMARPSAHVVTRRPAPVTAPALLPDPVAEVVAARGYASRRAAAPRAHVAPAASPARSRPRTALVELASVLAGVFVALALLGLRKGARIIGRRVVDETQDLGGAGLAVRGWVPAPGPRRRVRAVRRVRALSPLERERRPGGEWHRRARHARDGRG